MLPGPSPPRAPGATSTFVGSGAQSDDAGSHAVDSEHRRARRRVGLLIVVELDDLGRLEPRCSELGKAHHEHGADCEVRRDDAVARGEQMP